MFDAFNEYVFHMILSFSYGWRDSMAKVKSHFQWNIEQNELRF